MTDDAPIEITGGGAIAVDTATLRHTATRFALAAADLGEANDAVWRAQARLFEHRDIAWDAASSASALSYRILAAKEAAELIVSRLREAAAIYELVELDVAHFAAACAGDRAEMARLDAKRDDILDDYPDALSAAREAELWRGIMWPGDLVRQATETGQDLGSSLGERQGVIGGVVMGGGAIVATAVTGIFGVGIKGRDARLSGTAPAVALVEVAPAATASGAPQGLAAAASRIPRDSDARVRVERYTMPNGTREYAVYVSGMRSGGWGGADPWDGLSNVQLYSGERSASYQATVQALEAAGAQPGDTVHAFGHSQGAMVASWLALEGDFDTRTLVTFGSPIDADVGPSTLSVSVRHTDDPIVALAGGGHMGSVGAEGSMVVEREAHPASGPVDLGAPGHDLVGYMDTAGLIDESSDPRVDAVRAVFDDLTHATEVEVIEFTAVRGGRDDSAPAGVR